MSDALSELGDLSVAEADVREVLGELALTPAARAHEPLTFVVERELGEADLNLLATGARGSNVAERLRAVTYRHHLAARMIADGASNAEVALAANYAPSTVGQLRADPAFVELVQHYHTQKVAVYLDVHQRLGSLGMSAVDELQDRVDYLRKVGEDPVEDALAQARSAIMSTNLLKSIAEMALDRSVAPSRRAQGASGTVDQGGPSALTVNLNFAEPPKGVGTTIEGTKVEVETNVCEAPDGSG